MAGRLRSVLRVRRVQERRALTAVARAEAEARDAERDAEEAARRRVAWAIPSGVPLDRAGLRARQLAVLALHDEEAAALAEVAAAGHRRERARDAATEARSARRSVERLADHRRAIEAAHAAARAQAAADELVLLRRGREGDR